MARSKKPTANKKLLAAKAAHDKFLRSHGIDPSRKPVLRGVVDNDLVVTGNNRVTAAAVSADNIPGNGTKRDLQMRVQAGEEKQATLDKVKERANSCAPAYNKGPYMLITSKDELRGAKRRDR